MNEAYGILAKQLNSKYRLVHHALYIAFMFAFWYLFSQGIDTPARYVLFTCTYIVVCYFNIYILFPRYFLRGKTGAYLLFSLLTFILSFATQRLIYWESWEQFGKAFTPLLSLVMNLAVNAFTYCMFIGIGLSAKVLKMWLSSQLRVTSLEEQNLKARLSNLKSQVSPHFLFNTFNNLYVLTKTQPQVAAEMILGFADLMRYQLNEAENEAVDLEKELKYIENFLTLEKLRKDTLDLRLEYNLHDMEGIRVAPLLFAVLVENAVKHGSQQMEKAFIYVRMQRHKEQLYFEVVNSKPLVSRLGKEQSLGKGLDNLRKRLALSYPDAHQLKLTNEASQFTATLQLNLT